MFSVVSVCLFTWVRWGPSVYSTVPPLVQGPGPASPHCCCRVTNTIQAFLLKDPPPHLYWHLVSEVGKVGKWEIHFSWNAFLFFQFRFFHQFNLMYFSDYVLVLVTLFTVIPCFSDLFSVVLFQNLVLFQKVMVFYMTFFVIRILWFLVVIIGVMLFAYQVTDRVIIYYQHNTNVDVEVKYAPSVEFPSVTICNQNQFRYVFNLKFNLEQWIYLN